MIGPYNTGADGAIIYNGNKIFPRFENVANKSFDNKFLVKRTDQLSQNKTWSYISIINNTIYNSVNEYFKNLNAFYTLLPLTTRMISSPGAVYGKDAIDFTTDTSPIVIDWFDNEKKVFLAESSQIYLELSLLQNNVDYVYSIYNSFRKEEADFSHLSEFHHVEFEGKLNQEANLLIATKLIEKIIKDLIANNEKELSHFISNKRINCLEDKCSQLSKLQVYPFQEVLEMLYKDIKDEKYLSFSQQNFNSWEEIRITEILDGFAIVSEFPLLEVPFYHAEIRNRDISVANNADIIWPGYREILGSGQRIGGIDELEEKAKIFNLPADDYAPYLQSRKQANYTLSSGFGLGWERLLQGVLEMPFIWSAVHFPRGHLNIIT